MLSIGRSPVNVHTSKAGEGARELRSLGRLSTACEYLATFALVAFFGCDPQPALLTPTIEVQFAAQSDRGCQPLSTAESVRVSTVSSRSQTAATPSRPTASSPPAQSNRDNLVAGVPIDSQRLRAVACDGEQPRWSAESAITIEEDVKTRVQLRFGAPGQSNCFQFKASDTDRQFFSDRPSFLPASVVIPDTERLLVIGGAQNFDGELYTGDATAGWDVLGLDEFVYYKGIDRAANQASRPIDRVRIGAVGAVTMLGGRPARL